MESDHHHVIHESDYQNLMHERDHHHLLHKSDHLNLMHESDHHHLFRCNKASLLLAVSVGLLVCLSVG